MLKKYKSNFDKNSKNKLNLNKAQVQSVNEKLNITLDIIKSKYTDKNNEIKRQIADAKDNLKNKINELDLDVEFFIAASNQKSDIYDDEYENNVKKYNYQIEVAQDSYDTSIKEFNDAYNKKYLELENNYYKTIKRLESETQKINQTLQTKISEYSHLLQRYLGNLRIVNFETKEKNRQESVALNKEIKTLIDERNLEIVNARNLYSTSLNNSSTEKEEKRQVYQTEGQKIQKEFVISISEQDEYSNNCKKEFDSTIYNEEQNYYFNFLEKKLKQNQALEKLSKEITDEKEFRKKLKLNNKYSYFKKQEAKKECEKKLNVIECEYQQKAEEIRYNKTLLELNKNYNIKIINNKE